MQQYLQHVNHHTKDYWAASDDGMIHVSKDEENWKDVTPLIIQNILCGIVLNKIHLLRKLYVAGTHKDGDLNLTCLKLKTMVKPGLK